MYSTSKDWSTNLTLTVLMLIMLNNALTRITLIYIGLPTTIVRYSHNKISCFIRAVKSVFIHCVHLYWGFIAISKTYTPTIWKKKWQTRATLEYKRTFDTITDTTIYIVLRTFLNMNLKIISNFTAIMCHDKWRYEHMTVWMLS